MQNMHKGGTPCESPRSHYVYPMKALTRLILVTVLACALTACLFKEAIYEKGFSKIDLGLSGVWVAEGKDGDPRKMEFAVCAALDDDRYVLHHPSGEKGGIYYEARLLKIRDHSLLQLRVLAKFSDGLPKADAARYTLAWIEKDAAGSSIRVRALGGEGVKEKGSAEVKRLLELPTADWNSLFGEAMVFRRLKDN